MITVGAFQSTNQGAYDAFVSLNGQAEFSGTDIGLAIVKKIVENDHGVISSTHTVVLTI